MSKLNPIVALQKKHLDDWLLEAWSNHPITTEQHQEDFRHCFYAAKTYGQAVKTDLLLEYIERIKRLKEEVKTIIDVDKIEIKIKAIRLIEFKHDMLAAVIGECSREAKP